MLLGGGFSILVQIFTFRHRHTIKKMPSRKIGEGAFSFFYGFAKMVKGQKWSKHAFAKMVKGQKSANRTPQNWRQGKNGFLPRCKICNGAFCHFPGFWFRLQVTEKYFPGSEKKILMLQNLVDMP